MRSYMFRTEHSAEFFPRVVRRSVPYGTLWITLCALDLGATNSRLFVRSVPLSARQVRLFGLHVMKKAD